MAAPSYEAQETVYRLLQDRPDWRPLLENCLAWHRANPQPNEWHGFEWHQVRCKPFELNQLVIAGVVSRMPGSSRKYTYYQLSDPEAVAEALSCLVQIPAQNAAPVDVDAMFSLVAGHAQIKMLLRHALKADGPVHCLLVSEPGMAKTLILSEIGDLPGAQFYVGSTTSKSGLVGLLLSERPRFLVIDELDKADRLDMTPLLNLMETGTVTRLMHGSRERVQMDTKVFAGCNDVSRIDAPILSRFAILRIPPYSPAEFVEVAVQVLQQRCEQGPEMARLIATEVARHSKDIRDCVRVARMARRDPRRVAEIVGCLFPAVGRPQQLRPRR